MRKLLPIALSLFASVVGSFALPSFAIAQFGGTQDMMLEKQRRQQQAVTDAGNRPRGIWPSSNQPPANQPPPNPGHYHPHRPYHPGVNNHFYWPYPAYPSYGYGYGYGNDWRRPIIYPPGITVVPHGVPLTSEWLNGTYSSPLDPFWPYGGYGNLPVVPPVPFAFPEAPVVAARPAMPGVNGAPLAPAQAFDPVRPLNQAKPFDPKDTQDEIMRRVSALKPSTEAGRLRSDELIATGDKEFAAQQYRRAAAKYREAIAKAPDYAAGHLRAGHAYIATGDYELAVTYLAMGFELSRNIKQPGFSLADLYRGNALAQEQHQESLADAILRQPQDGGLLFLTGIMQHYSGRPLQARDYFRRAAEIPGRHQNYAAMFLPKAEEKVIQE